MSYLWQGALALHSKFLSILMITYQRIVVTEVNDMQLRKAKPGMRIPYKTMESIFLRYKNLQL